MEAVLAIGIVLSVVFLIALTIFFREHLKSLADVPSRRKKVGVINSLELGYKKRNQDPVTLLQIVDTRNKIWYAACAGHDSGLSKHMELEFWLTPDVFGVEEIPYKRTRIGIVELGTERIVYWNLKAYKVFLGS